MQQQFNWKLEGVVEALKAAWFEGLSASQIARLLQEQFGGRVTRNTIIGKVHRLGFAGHDNRKREPSIARTPAHYPRPKQRPRAIPEIENIEPLPLTADEIIRGPIRLTDLKSEHCRYPIGDPHDEDFHFCGRQKASDPNSGFLGAPYCEAHCRKAYQPLQPPRARRAA